MQNLFIIHNQDGYFLGKSGDWLDGREPTQLFRAQHKDEAVNQLFEANHQNVELRLSILECAAKTRLIPDIPAEKMPPPILKAATNASEDGDSEATTENEVSMASL